MRLRWQDHDRIRPSVPVFGAIGLAALFVLLAIVLGPVDATVPDWFQGDDRGGGGPTDPAVTLTWGTESFRPPEPDAGWHIDLPFAQILLGIAVAAVLWIAFLISRMLKDRKRRTARIVGGEIDDSFEELRKAAEDAENALRGSGSSTDAIIAAWLTLESAAAESGKVRKAAETPSEFTAALLRYHHADPEAVQTLLQLYHRARFATHPDLTSGDVQAARAALNTIVQTLATAAPTGERQ